MSELILTCDRCRKPTNHRELVGVGDQWSLCADCLTALRKWIEQGPEVKP